MGKYKELEMELQDGYEKAVAEMNAFITKTLQDYSDKGVQVDPSSYKDQAYKVYVLGKLYALGEAVRELKEGKKVTKKVTKKATKGAKNVARKKRTSRKKAAKSDNQLEFGL